MTQAIAPSATTITLTSNKTYYSIYRTNVTIYRPSAVSGTNSCGNITVYRNQWFTSTTAMSSTVISTSTTGTSNMTSISGLLAGIGMSILGFVFYGCINGR